MIEYIQAGDGTAHVSSADDGALFSTIVGTGNYVGKGLAEGLPLTIKDNNHLILGTGTGWHNGRGFRVISNEGVTIQSGTQGQRRIDLIVSRYVVDGSIERGSIAVIKGEPVQDGSEPAVPKHETGNILEGVSISDFPLYAVKLNGLQIESTERLFTAVPSLSDLMGLMEVVQRSVKAIEAKNASQDTAIAGKAPTSHASAGATYGKGTGSAYGHVKLSDSTTSASDANGGVAATPKAVKKVWDSLSQSVPIVTDGRYADIQVSGYRRAGTVCIRVKRSGSGLAYSWSDRDSVIGRLLKADCPLYDQIALVGVQDGAWLYLIARANGDICLRHDYGPQELGWSIINGTLTFPAA